MLDCPAPKLGIDHTLRIVDLRKGEQKSREYAALNPNMRMPILRDDDYLHCIPMRFCRIWRQRYLMHPAGVLRLAPLPGARDDGIGADDAL
jgi:hypothetical protein